MYCSSCGAIVADNLIYCNQCGAKIGGPTGDRSRVSEISPFLLVLAMVVTFAFGMAAMVSGATGMKRNGFDEPIIYAFLIFSSLLILALEGIFVWLLLGRRRVEKEVRGVNQLNEKAKKELYARPAREFTEPVPSVTDQTTNQLEPLFHDQKSKRN